MVFVICGAQFAPSVGARMILLTSVAFIKLHSIMCVFQVLPIHWLLYGYSQAQWQHRETTQNQRRTVTDRIYVSDDNMRRHTAHGCFAFYLAADCDAVVIQEQHLYTSCLINIRLSMSHGLCMPEPSIVWLVLTCKVFMMLFCGSLDGHLCINTQSYAH